MRCRVDSAVVAVGHPQRRLYHRELGLIMWEYCGMERTADGLRKAIDLIRGLRADFWRNVKVLGSATSLNQCWRRPAGWPTSWSWAS